MVVLSCQSLTARLLAVTDELDPVLAAAIYTSHRRQTQQRDGRSAGAVQRRQTCCHCPADLLSLSSGPAVTVWRTCCHCPADLLSLSGGPAVTVWRTCSHCPADLPSLSGGHAVTIKGMLLLSGGSHSYYPSDAVTIHWILLLSGGSCSYYPSVAVITHGMLLLSGGSCNYSPANLQLPFGESSSWYNRAFRKVSPLAWKIGTLTFCFPVVECFREVPIPVKYGTAADLGQRA